MNALIQPGRILAGRYRIDQQIGVGGMAVVYRATDLNTQHFVAVKVLKPEYNRMRSTSRAFSGRRKPRRK